jgi:hypothetical protein
MNYEGPGLTVAANRSSAAGSSGKSVRLMNAEQVAKEVFGGTVTADWVKRNLCGPHTGRVKLGHKTIRWNRPTVEAYVARLEER